MGSLAALLLSLATSIPGRVLTALGVGWITFSGVTSAVDSVRSGALSAWGSLPGDIAALFGLAGIDEGIGVILGAVVAKAAIIALPKLGRLSS